MRWQPFPLVGGAYTDDAKPWSAQDTVNLIPEVAGTGDALSPVGLRSAPGLASFATTENAPVRGLYDVEGTLFGVVGRTLYRVRSGLVTSLGTIPGVDRVSIAHNQITGGNEVVIANGSTGYVYNTVTEALAQITDPGFIGAKVVDYADQYIVGVEPMGRFWFHSDLAAATSYNTLDRYEAEGEPDRIVTLVVTHGDVLVLGKRTGEFFYNTGAATNTFARRDGTSMEVGCASAHAARRLDNSTIWLGNDGVVYRLDGYSPRRISTHAIEQALSRGALSDAFAFTYNDRGHAIYYLTVPDGQTWGYDVSTDLWHRRQSKGMTRWRVSALVRSDGRWIAGDAFDGSLYTLDWTIATERGEPMDCRRVAGPLHDNGNRLGLNALRVDIDTGKP